MLLDVLNIGNFSCSINFISTEYTATIEKNRNVLEIFDLQVWIGAGGTLALIFISRSILTGDWKSSLWWIVLCASQKGSQLWLH
jgi:hypothetical protein